MRSCERAIWALDDRARIPTGVQGVVDAAWRGDWLAFLCLVRVKLWLILLKAMLKVSSVFASLDGLPCWVEQPLWRGVSVAIRCRAS